MVAPRVSPVLAWLPSESSTPIKRPKPLQLQQQQLHSLRAGQWPGKRSKLSEIREKVSSASEQSNGRHCVWILSWETTGTQAQLHDASTAAEARDEHQ